MISDTLTAVLSENSLITAISFSSVSLDPALVLWNVNKVTNSLNAFLEVEDFAFNILTNEQRDLSQHSARSEKGLFHNIPHGYTERGAPLLPDILANLECRTGQVHECGDHFIIIGEVIDFQANDSEPLLFFNGDYAAIRTA